MAALDTVARIGGHEAETGTAGVAPTRFAWLSIAAALATITLKTAAFALTGSVGLLSDALESVVNHHFHLDQFIEAYDVFARAGDTGALKVVLTRQP